MILFDIEFVSGVPVYEQIVFGVKKALARGRLRPGDRFPAVREISRAFKVNPNTVQKALAEMTRQGLLEIHPGKGAFVAEAARAGEADLARAVAPLVEELVVEACSLGLSRKQLNQLINDRWKELRNEPGVEH